MCPYLSLCALYTIKVACPQQSGKTQLAKRFLNRFMRGFFFQSKLLFGLPLHELLWCRATWASPQCVAQNLHLPFPRDLKGYVDCPEKLRAASLFRETRPLTLPKRSLCSPPPPRTALLTQEREVSHRSLFLAYRASQAPEPGFWCCATCHDKRH